MNSSSFFNKSLIVIILGTLFFIGCGIPEGEKISSPITQEEAIEVFRENQEKKVYTYSPDEGVPVCVTEVLKEFTDPATNEKIVYAPTSCARVVVKEGDLRSTGGGAHGPFFKLTTGENGWQVIDEDDRISPHQPGKDWVEEYEKKLDSKTRQASGPIPLGAKLTIKAGKKFGISTPAYTFASCKKESDCSTGEVCMLQGQHSNLGKNTCIKTCTGHLECGAGYSCRRQCIHGENGCPTTAVPVCIPDLLHVDLEKGDGII